jgi:hypothetical protein
MCRVRELNLMIAFSQECRASREGHVTRLVILEAALIRDIQLMEQWWWMGGPDPTFRKGYQHYPSMAAFRYLIQEVWRHRNRIEGEPFPIER